MAKKFLFVEFYWAEKLTDMTLAIYDGFCFMIVPLPEVCAKHATITFSKARQ